MVMVRSGLVREVSKRFIDNGGGGGRVKERPPFLASDGTEWIVMWFTEIGLALCTSDCG